MNAERAWQAVLGQLQVDIPKATYDTWVRDTALIAYEDGSFIVGVQNTYARDWLDNRLKKTVTNILTGIMNRTVEVRFAVWQDSPMDEAAPVSSSSKEVATTGPPSAFLNPHYTFETFVVGGNSRLAHAASLAVVERPALAYNPLFLYGGVGLGKTHLLHAIGNVCGARGLHVLYVSSEEFTNDLINAIRTHTTPAFREKYRHIDVLLIDDIHFIAGKESTQEEFFHTFNTLHGQNKQLVISSDRPPKALVTLEERLRSRFEWGLTADIQAPDLETRLAILRAKAEQRGRQVPDDILNAVAHAIQANIRELEGALTRVLAYGDLLGLPLTVDLVDSALGDMLPKQRDLAPEGIVQAVAEAFGLPMVQLIGRDRSREVALPRQIAMYLLREETGISLPQIGEVLGGRDHTTVMYGCDKVADLLERDERLRRQVTQIRESIFEQVNAPLSQRYPKIYRPTP
jgi:chromosomal replication initiator protein